MQGKFIAFEGGDGVGKTTQSTRLVNYLKEKGHDTIYTKEPGGYSKDIRQIILDLIARKEEESRIALLFTAERMLHNVYKIEPALEEGKIVVSDRYFYSTVAYQGTSVPMQDVLRLNLEAGKVRIPDIVIYIDLSPEEAVRRAKVRGKTIRYEEVEFQEKFRENFRKLLETRPEMRIIDGRGSREEVFARVLEVLKSAGLIE